MSAEFTNHKNDQKETIAESPSTPERLRFGD